MRFNLRLLLFAVMPVLAVWAAVLGRYGRTIDLVGCLFLALGLLVFLLPIWAIYMNDRKVNMPEREDDPTSPSNRPPRSDEV